MKQASASCKGLFYHELLIGKRTFIGTFGMLAGFLLIIYLIIASFDSGIFASQPPEDLLMTKKMIRTIGIQITAALLFLNLTYTIDGAAAESSEKWKNFIYASPVSDAKYYGVKYAVMLILTVLGFGLSLLNGYILCEILDMPLTFTDISFMAVMMTLIVLGMVLCTVSVSFFSSVNVALNVIFALVAVVVLTGCILFRDSLGELLLTEEESGMLNPAFVEKMTDFCETLMPFTFFIVIAVLVLGWVLTVAIQKNRERKLPLAHLFQKKSCAAKEG